MRQPAPVLAFATRGTRPCREHHHGCVFERALARARGCERMQLEHGGLVARLPNHVLG